MGKTYLRGGQRKSQRALQMIRWTVRLAASIFGPPHNGTSPHLY